MLVHAWAINEPLLTLSLGTLVGVQYFSAAQVNNHGLRARERGDEPRAGMDGPNASEALAITNELKVCCKTPCVREETSSVRRFSDRV